MRVLALFLLLLLMAAPAMAEAPVTIHISAAGDCTLGGESKGGGESRFAEMAGDEGYEYYLRLVKPIFEADDLTIVNLEGPLTTATARQKGKEFCFRGDPEYTQILSAGSVEALNLANNHMLDYGKEGYEDTKAALERAGIVHFGFGEAAVYEVKGVKIGLAGFYSQERSEMLEVLAALRAECEVVIISLHTGVERDAKPSGKAISFAHAAIDAGADLVLAHHPHVIQGIELYKDKYIAYSLGNFCFGGNRNPSDKDTFILKCAITVADGKVMETAIEAVPCSVSSEKGTNNYQPMPLEGDEYDRVLKKIIDRSKRLSTPGIGE